MKVYGMVPNTWILQCLKIFKVAENVRNVIEKSMKNWKVKLTSGGEKLGEIKKQASFKATVYHQPCLS